MCLVRDVDRVGGQCSGAVAFPSSGRRIGCVVSMRAVPWPEPDPVVATAIRAKYAGRRVPLAVAVRDRLGQWMADELFAAAFGVRGRHSRCGRVANLLAVPRVRAAR